MDARAWSGLQMRHLLALEAIAEHGSFHRAAAALDYTQSGISQQIAALERIAGTRLVDRPVGARPARLTGEGERLLGHARAILDRLAAARADLTTASRPLRVGAFQSIGATLLPPLLDAVAHEAPDLEIELTQTTADDALLERVRAGKLDVTFAAQPLPAGPFATVELMWDPFVVLVGDGSSLVRRDGPVADADLDGVPLVAPRTCRYTGLLEARMRDAGLHANVVQRADDDGTVLALVARGAAVACVPALVAAAADDRLHVLELAKPMQRRIVLAWNRNRTEDARRDRFIEQARAMTVRHHPTAIS